MRYLSHSVFMKTLEEYFRDWHSNTFGFGYGTGEEHTIPALKSFLELCNEGDYHHGYHYRKLEAALTPATAWLFINILCNHKVDVLEYGSSPRFAWLTTKGDRLKRFVSERTADQLYELCTGYDENYSGCYPDACNCGETGYEEGLICQNPFWLKEVSITSPKTPTKG